MFELLDQQKSWFYICGDAKHMAKDVVDAMATIVTKKKGISKGMGEKYMHNLKITGLFHVSGFRFSSLLSERSANM